MSQTTARLAANTPDQVIKVYLLLMLLSTLAAADPAVVGAPDAVAAVIAHAAVTAASAASIGSLSRMGPSSFVRLSVC